MLMLLLLAAPLAFVLLLLLLLAAGVDVLMPVVLAVRAALVVRVVHRLRYQSLLLVSGVCLLSVDVDVIRLLLPAQHAHVAQPAVAEAVQQQGGGGRGVAQLGCSGQSGGVHVRVSGVYSVVGVHALRDDDDEGDAHQQPDAHRGHVAQMTRRQGEEEGQQSDCEGGEKHEHAEGRGV